MPSIKYRDGQNFPAVSVKVGDTLPVGTELDYDGNSVPLGWEQVADGDLIVSASEPSGNDRRKVWLQSNSKNILNINDLMNATIDNSGNYITDNAQSRLVFGYTYVTPSTDVVFTLNTNAEFYGIAFYDINKTFISRIVNYSYDRITGTTPSNAYYVRPFVQITGGNLTLSSVNQYEIQLELGTERTTFEPITYDNMYILDVNNIYNEFKNKGTILYEKPTGSTGNITLYENASNFDYIEIFYQDDQAFASSIKIKGNDTQFIIHFNKPGAAGNIFYMYATRYSISNNVITVGIALIFQLTASGITNNGNNNNISITKIIGYK